VILQGLNQDYELDFSVNARCRLEALTGRSFMDVLRELAGKRRPPESTVRSFLSALLPEPPEDARSVLADIGGYRVIRAAAQAAWRVHRQQQKSA
jgi:hypothetical protein